MKKRTCNDCRCLQSNHVRMLTCELGYSIERKIIGHVDVSAKPLEDCPKPKTYEAYLFSLKNDMKRC